MKKPIKKIVLLILTLSLVVGGCFALVACDKNKNDTIVVYTNAFFAPFEYYDGTAIKGVDIDIMNEVATSMNKKIKFQNVDFGIIVDEVASGKLCDAGAAGITWTAERAAKVDFSVPYYKSVQYVIAKKTTFAATDKTTDDADCIFWSQLEGKKIGVQLDTTGDIFVGGEIEEGVLAGKSSTLVQMDNAQLAFEALATSLDVVVVDELPAKYLVKNNASEYICLPLYYDADTATEEEYCIAVNKGQAELLKAINTVLNKMMATKDETGKNQIELLVSKHLGIN